MLKKVLTAYFWSMGLARWSLHLRAEIKMYCQKWNSNPSPQKWTANWMQRLIPLCHRDMALDYAEKKRNMHCPGFEPRPADKHSTTEPTIHLLDTENSNLTCTLNVFTKHWYFFIQAHTHTECKHLSVSSFLSHSGHWARLAQSVER